MLPEPPDLYSCPFPTVQLEKDGPRREVEGVGSDIWKLVWEQERIQI